MSLRGSTDPPAPADPRSFPVDEAAYRAGPHAWLDELDGPSVGPGPPFHRMGTAAVPESAWLLPDRHRGRELALRRSLVIRAGAHVVGILHGTDAACAEAAALVDRWLATYRSGVRPAGSAGPDELPPLVRAGLAVQEDLCVMVRDGDEWRLGAAVVCFPSFWRLGDKLGRTQQDVHVPVPRYDVELSARVSKLLDRLSPGRIVARRNWGFASSAHLFVPDVAALGDPGAFDPARWWLRSERQTLQRLPVSGAVLFTIRVQLAPLEAVGARPSLAARLVEAMDSWPPELVAGRSGGQAWYADAARWLRAAGAVSGPAPPEASPSLSD